MIPLQPPCLPIHLLPFTLGLYRHLDAAQVDPAALAARPAVAGRLFAGSNHAQPPGAGIDKFLAVARQLEAAHVVSNALAFIVLKNPGAQRAYLRLAIVVVFFFLKCPAQGESGVEGTPGCAGDLAVLSVGDREGQHAAFDAF